MKRLARVVLLLPLLLLSPLAIAIPVLALAVGDLLGRLFGRKRLAPDRRPRTAAASVVIPNWNGRELLEKYLPSVEAALAGNPENEIVVVDNGSTDGSAAFLGERFPRVRVGWRLTATSVSAGVRTRASAPRAITSSCC